MSADISGGTGLPDDSGLLDDTGLLGAAGNGNGGGPVEPGLDVLLGLLTSGPTPDELAGESLALEMFRSNRYQAAIAQKPDVAGPSAIRGQVRRTRWLAAAGTVAAAAALTVAAYTQALPAPLQNVAYHVLGFVGVPQAHHTTKIRHTGPAKTRVRLQAGASRPTPAVPAPPTSPKVTPVKAALPTEPARLSVAVARHQIVAGHRDVFVARLTDHGAAVPGARLYLLERTAGERTWRIVADAATGPAGRVVVTVSGITTNAVFRFRGPRGTLSNLVQVTVVPAMSVIVRRGPRGQAETVIAVSPGALPGDLFILQVRFDGRWLTVAVQELYGGGRVRFVVKIVGVKRAYRVFLPPTKDHGGSVSRAVTVSGRGGSSGSGPVAPG